MTKAEFIDKIKDIEGVPPLTKAQAGVLLQGFVDILEEAIKRDSRFTYPGFGTFKVKSRAARKGRNPKTKDVIDIPASKTVTFKPSTKFKESL